MTPAPDDRLTHASVHRHCDDGHVKRVFLSSVSQEYGLNRPVLKQRFRAVHIDLRVQEDFADRASPYGTLVRIHQFIEMADMVVHVIGSHSPHSISQAEYAELFGVLPHVRDWFAEAGLLAAVEAAEIGYSHFEAYLALHLNKPLVIVRRGRGTQQIHERRLQDLGRHINGTFSQPDELIDIAIRALNDEANLGRDRHQQRSAVVSRQRSLVTITLLAATFVLALGFHLSALGADTSSLVSFCALAVCVFGLHMAAMSDQLMLRFRLRASACNATVWLLLATMTGWLIAPPDQAYWVAPICLLILLGFAVRADTRSLEDELSHARGVTPGAKLRSDGWYWKHRRDVLNALRVLDR